MSEPATEKGQISIPLWEKPLTMEAVLEYTLNIDPWNATIYQQKAATKIAEANRFWLMEAALEVVNNIRTAVAIGEGLLPELPKAIKGNSRHCVLARALSNGWSATVTGTGSVKLDHPTITQEQMRTAVLALEQMDLPAHLENYPSGEFTEVVDDPRTKAQMFHISIGETPLFRALVDSFDNGHLPDLIFTSEEQREYERNLPAAERAAAEATAGGAIAGCECGECVAKREEAAQNETDEQKP